MVGIIFRKREKSKGVSESNQWRPREIGSNFALRRFPQSQFSPGLDLRFTDGTVGPYLPALKRKVKFRFERAYALGNSQPKASRARLQLVIFLVGPAPRAHLGSPMKRMSLHQLLF